MIAIRQIHDNLADVIPVPPELRHRKTEVIFIAIDDTSADNSKSVSGQLVAEVNNASLTELFGSIGDFPDRDPQGEFDSRLELP